MERKQAGKGKKRMPLSRERVLKAAMALADKEGMESVTMRRLGQKLGVEAMSLYKYFPSKEEMFDGLADVIQQQIYVPEIREDWREGMLKRGHSAREVYKRFPWALGLVESRVHPVPSVNVYCNAVLGCLRNAGFSNSLAMRAFSIMDSFIYGAILQEIKSPMTSSDEIVEIAGSLVNSAFAESFPYMTDLITNHVVKEGYNHDKEFEFGLNLVLNGLEVELGKAQKARKN